MFMLCAHVRALASPSAFDFLFFLLFLLFFRLSLCSQASVFEVNIRIIGGACERVRGACRLARLRVVCEQCALSFPQR